jgi:hypothetical protein
MGRNDGVERMEGEMTRERQKEKNSLLIISSNIGNGMIRL